MPCRIRVHQRFIMTVCIQIEAQRIIVLSGIRIFLHKPRGDGIIHTGVQVVKTGLFVVLVAGIEDVVIDGSGLGEDVAECVVVIGRDDISGGVQKGRHIGVSVVHVGQGVPFHLPGDKVDPVDISSCLVSGGILFKYYLLVFVQISGHCAVDRFADAQAVSVVGAKDNRSGRCYRFYQLIEKIVGIGLFHDRGLGSASNIGGAGLRELISIVVIGVDDCLGDGAIEHFLSTGQSVLGIVCVGGDGRICAQDYGLGQAVAGCIKCIACCFVGRLRYGKEAV